MQEDSPRIAPELAQKLLELQKSVTHLVKDARNEQQRYDYVSSSAVLDAVREVMDKLGLLLLVEVVDHSLHLGGAYDGKQHMTEVELLFTWVNVEDPAQMLQQRWYGQGVDGGEKGFGKAMTYSEKYYILKALHIPTDSDDPDADTRSTIRTSKTRPEDRPRKSPRPDKDKLLTEVMELIGDKPIEKALDWGEEKMNKRLPLEEWPPEMLIRFKAMLKRLEEEEED